MTEGCDVGSPLDRAMRARSLARKHQTNCAAWALYHERQFYPAKSIRDVGGVLAAASDDPVDTLDPQLLINIEIGVTRVQPGYPPANPRERLTIRDLLDAYTMNGAGAMSRQGEFGSLEVGK
jgi:predicted amidohydrolase YtcJ